MEEGSPRGNARDFALFTLPYWNVLQADGSGLSAPSEPLCISVVDALNSSLTGLRPDVSRLASHLL